MTSSLPPRRGAIPPPNRSVCDRRGSAHRSHQVPGTIDSFDPASSGDPEIDDEPPSPRWADDLADAADRDRLAAAATGPVDLASLTALVGMAPAELDAPALLDAISASQRLINHFQALQQRYLAALARPGVAVPLENLVEAALRPGSGRNQPFRPLSDTALADLPADSAGEVDYAPLLDQPDWHTVLVNEAARAASAEVGCLLNLAPITARVRTEKALAMVDDLPATLMAQQRGELDGYRADIIAERTSVLLPPQRRSIEQRILPVAEKRTGAALRRLTDREVIAADPEAATRRETSAQQGRTVTVGAVADGMAALQSLLPAPDAALVHGVLDSVATSLRAAGLADGRGAGQLRADALVDLFRALNSTGHAHICVPTKGDADQHRPGSNPRPPDDGPHRSSSDQGNRECRAGSGMVPCRQGCSPPPPRRGADESPAGNAAAHLAPRHSVALHVYVDADTLGGKVERPGELGGYGAINAATARALAESAASIRAHLVTERGLSPGKRVYSPSPRIADAVTARDRTCRFPGCRTPARRCDLDHRQPFGRGGDTTLENLDLLCRAHHRLKTFTPWRAERIGDGPGAGALAWVSPLGRRYETEVGHILLDQPSDAPGARGNTGSDTVDPPPF